MKRCDNEHHKQRQHMVHCNDFGENEAFEWLCKQERMGVNFECAKPGTPWQKRRVEKKLATLFIA